MGMEFKIRGEYARTYCRGAEEGELIQIKTKTSTTEHVDRLNSHYTVAVDKNGVPLNCPRYEDGMCHTFELGDEIPQDAKVLIGNDGLCRTIKLVRHKCIVGAELREILGPFKKD